MQPVRNFAEMKERARELPSRRVAVVRADEAETLTAVMTAVEENMIDAVLIGGSDAIKRSADKAGVDVSSMDIIEAAEDEPAAEKAVELIRNGEAHLIMKGLVASSIFLKAILDHEKGIRGPGLLSHVAVFDIPTYPKLLTVTDAGMNIKPRLEQKVQILHNAITVVNALGIDYPKSTYLCAKEIPYEKMPRTMEAAKIKKMVEDGEITGTDFDGPLAMDLAVSPEAVRIKGIKSTVAGQADIVLLPDIESANILYKTLLFLSSAEGAAVIMGATHPVTLTSRADSAESKLCSLVLAGIVASYLES
ncbi:MAG: bifunctional enoyl-CoA hydratase/phosphate acetyltransferase [Candidatus Fermentibacteraceae bacterium]|nr:bifunctional enoyl-CoA hydratase/phosphate acetyltransferase [Candidatus Fermentibacteraceae bacterium]